MCQYVKCWLHWRESENPKVWAKICEDSKSIELIDDQENIDINYDDHQPSIDKSNPHQKSIDLNYNSNNIELSDNHQVQASMTPQQAHTSISLEQLEID